MASDNAGPTASSESLLTEESEGVVCLKIASASRCLDGAEGAVNSNTI